MATLVFGALGTLVGGPIGGALGTLIGREVDREIIGTPSRVGPRLTELAVSSSSYGQPIARQFGRVRGGGTILWATDLQETSESSGGGKGSPSTTSYSYSVSLAIAVSSRPIGGVGRIWADGNLLRGAQGDLKTGGSLRIYTGHEDQMPDPLLAAALGEQCPAHRGLAYIVFEDLQLADFGNRIPALSFELLPEATPSLIAAIAGPAGDIAATALPDEDLLAGFTQDGGSIAETLALLARVIPLAVRADGDTMTLFAPRLDDPMDATLLGPPVAWPDGEFGPQSGTRAERQTVSQPIEALRYYDTARDFQPGLQRAGGRAAATGGKILELPASLAASDAGTLIRKADFRQRAAADALRYRVAEIDPALGPGTIVGVPGRPGWWRITGWEWREGGIELDLLRHVPLETAEAGRDPGSAWLPPDRPAAATMLDVFELPFDGAGSPDIARIYAAVGAGSGRWAGAALYVERDAALLRLSQSSAQAAAGGTLAEALAPSPALMFEPQSALTIACDRAEMSFANASLFELANGANRLLIGEEIVQFATAEQIAATQWRLTGLLRGRGGSEIEASSGHPIGTRVILLDHRLTTLDPAGFDPASERIAALGLGDTEPVFAAVESPGRTLRPLSPVHGSAGITGDGSLALGWTRRARGAWDWPEEVEVPLVEQSELYEVGVGDSDTPAASWLSDVPQLLIDASEMASLGASHAGSPVWVRQIGSYGKSPGLELTTIA